MEKERWGVHVDGILVPGFSSQEEAEQYISENNLNKKWAVSTLISDEDVCGDSRNIFNGIGIA